MRVHKIIKDNHGNEITIYGTNRWQHVHSTHYKNDHTKETVQHYGKHYDLSDFCGLNNFNPSWMRAFDGYHIDSFFSGILIKYAEDGEEVKIFTYIK